MPSEINPGKAPTKVVSVIPGLLLSGKYSDLLLEGDGHSWRVHKFVLCEQSSFFAKAFESNTWEEGKSGKINLSYDHFEAIDAVLQYLYTSTYDYQSSLTRQDRTVHPLLLDVLVYTLADKLDLQPVVELASKRFRDRVLGKKAAGLSNQEMWKDLIFVEAIRELYLKRS